MARSGRRQGERRRSPAARRLIFNQETGGRCPAPATTSNHLEKPQAAAWVRATFRRIA